MLQLPADYGLTGFAGSTAQSDIVIKRLTKLGIESMQQMGTDAHKYIVATTQMLFWNGSHQSANLIKAQTRAWRISAWTNGDGTKKWMKYLAIEPVECGKLAATLSVVDEPDMHL